ncbi:hypothetical protein K474DRAFT_1628650 [Panus rudis PR-1116 ss-1]|nr:hypothetical protein K474DRAFT_1628650 [Panus rudis PR-1116 ss-1]
MLTSTTLQFYSEAILSRRGPLAKVWLAAHMERKLSKTQTLQTNIEQSVDAIMGQEVEVMALRLSGQLLLGVVRIYSRKAKYLLDDCNEALLKIKMAFRPGIVDMTEDQLAVNRNAITLPGNNLDLNALIPDINWDVDFENRVVQPGGQHIARTADITLATVGDFQMDFDEPNYGFDLGPSDGIGSQDFDIDLGLDFGDGPVSAAGEPTRTGGDDDESMEMEVGRRDAGPARTARESLASHLLGPGTIEEDILSRRSREASEQPFGGDDFGPDLGDMDIDLGLSFGDRPISEPPQTPRLSPSRESTPLTEPPETPPPEVELTPRVEPETGKVKRKPKEKKQIIDTVTELANGPGARVGRGRGAAALPPPPDVSEILTEHQFLPRSTLAMRLLEIREDPLSHFLPTKVTPNGTFFCAAPPGLAPELQELFMRPVQSLSAQKRRASPEKEPEQPPSPSKRARTEGSVAGEEIEDVEQARRASSVAPSIALGSEALGGRASIGPGLEFPDTGGVEDFQMDIPEFEMQADLLPEERARSKSVLSELSRLTTPAPEAEGEETYADASCPIAIFDDRSSSTQDQSSQASSDDGYSRNTVKALAIIRRELQPTPEEPEKVMSFKKMSEKATKRAAASFFFELLVLGTRDCVKISQSGPFENIEVTAKNKLWERQQHSSVAPSQSAFAPSSSRAQSSRLGSATPSVASPSRKQGSAAPSIASAFGL